MIIIPLRVDEAFCLSMAMAVPAFPSKYSTMLGGFVDTLGAVNVSTNGPQKKLVFKSLGCFKEENHWKNVETH